MVGNSHMGNTHSRPDIQPQFQLAQFRLKPEPQNAALERKPIHLPPVRLREAFSYIFPPCLLFSAGMKFPAHDLLGALMSTRLSFVTESDADAQTVAQK
jgi:hypothetical protein